MKWKKLGKIFDPTEHELPNNCREFAQSPQTIVFEDFVRVYFSTRERDQSGKYLSHVAFVDFDKSWTEIRGISHETVIELGGTGCFDEHGIFPVNVLRDGDKILAYTTGWNRKVSVSADACIGLAVSRNDGLTFTKPGPGPILAASLNEPFLVADAFVTKYGDTYHMWYIYGLRWAKGSETDPPDRVYKIAHAASADGINWLRDGRQIISDKLNSDECQALPTVIRHDGIYHMFFCYRQAFGFRKEKDNGYRIGYAFSEDLSNWTRDDDNVGLEVSEEGWDSDMLCYPHVFRCDDRIFMLYNGNEFGRFGFGLAVLEG